MHEGLADAAQSRSEDNMKKRSDADLLPVTAAYYQQFDADYTRAVPAEGFGGWKQADLSLSRSRTAVVVMHAWDTGRADAFPGWHRCVEYHPRADAICREVLPPLLAAVRKAGLPLFHVTSSSRYCADEPGYRRACALAGPDPEPPPRIPSCAVLDRLRAFKAEHAFVGGHNAGDVNAGFSRLDFPPAVRPLGDEGVAENTHQLFALCQAQGINHLIYAGFAINWCLMFSPGGMVDMSRRGFLCSAFRQAVTAVENKASARDELGKEMALWRIAVAFGFVFNVDAFIRALAEA